MLSLTLKLSKLLLVLSLILSEACAVEIIVHRQVGVETISRNQARTIFGMRQVVWPDKSEIKVFVLPDGHGLHSEFCKSLLGIYPYQLRASWERLVFSGMGQAPIEVASEEEMLARVAHTPGAVGYVEKAGGVDAVRVLAIH